MTQVRFGIAKFSYGTNARPDAPFRKSGFVRPISEVLIDSTHVKAHRSAAAEKGAHFQAIGISRGGRNTKVHAITDRPGRPLAFLLTPGQAADCRAAEHLLNTLPRCCIVHADRAYGCLDKALNGQRLRLTSTTLSL